MGDEKSKARPETKLQWWMRYVVVPIGVAIIGGGTYLVVNEINIFNTFRSETPVTDSSCHLVSERNAIPESNNVEILTVEPNQFHLWSAGPVSVVYENEEIFSSVGGVSEGNIILLLPVNNQATQYTMRNINIASNWHGIWGDCEEGAAIAQLENKAYVMNQPNTGNCSASGCSDVYMITIEGLDSNISPYNG